MRANFPFRVIAWSAVLSGAVCTSSQAELAFSVERGFSREPSELTLLIEGWAGCARYTLDSSIPSLTPGASHVTPLTISQTTVVRAVANCAEPHSGGEEEERGGVKVNSGSHNMAAGSATAVWEEATGGMSGRGVSVLLGAAMATLGLWPRRRGARTRRRRHLAAPPHNFGMWAKLAVSGDVLP